MISINYPSFRTSLERVTETIDTILSKLPRVDEFNFVAHSLGGLIVRKLFERKRNWKQNSSVNRIVMIATPNNGSQLAQWLDQFSPLGAMTGSLLSDLRPERVRNLPTPDADIGVISGGTGTQVGLNPFLDGDNDGTVRVQSTKLSNKENFLQITGQHSLLLSSERVTNAVRTFIKRGTFEEVQNG